MQEQLRTFGTPQENVQPNLVTKDGTLAEELTKSRMLGVRLAGRVASMKRGPEVRDHDAVFHTTSQNKKLKEALKDF